MNFKEQREFYSKEFFRRAKEIHGDKYIYDSVIYEKAKIPVEIICPFHGSFWQTPDKHLMGQNCKKCWLENINKDKLVTKEYFESKARSLHSDLYDYSLVIYKNMHTDVEIDMGNNANGRTV